MSIDIQNLYKIVDKINVLTDKDILNDTYCKPILDGTGKTPIVAILPKNTKQIQELFRYFRKIKGINVVIISSQTSPKFLNDTVSSENTVIIDLKNMKDIPFINKRNRVCVVEPGVTWDDLIPRLKDHGMRPLAPFLHRPGKSVLASVLDREPHMIPKKQFDISDPLLCMEVVFGNGEMFRTGEAAGPQSIEENRKFGGALTNPLGPGQTDIFRIIQGAKGSYGCVSWISMQCDLIPEKRVIRFIESDSIVPLTEMLYSIVKKRWIEEAFIINANLFKATFPSTGGALKEYIMIYAINGYELFPEDKVAYQTASCNEILSEIGLEAKDSIAGITQKEVEPILDGHTVEPHPKYSEKDIAVDLFYNTTLDRLQSHISGAKEILNTHGFPLERTYIYIQPVIQARAVNVEFSLLADRPDFGGKSPEFALEKVNELVREIAKYVASNGAFFSRSYPLINYLA
ncbi:MAG: FAD-dependent oxidoreductase, partial [Candidatus Hodarchaeota archaeon]